MPKFKDLTGQKFGRLTVVKNLGIKKRNNGQTKRYWLCKCDCGNQKEVITENLIAGITKSCGCARKFNFKDLTGQRFGRLTVIRRVEDKVQPSGKKKTQWLCKCDCGVEHITTASALLKGESKSCGCLHKEFNRTHGMTNSRLYRIWSGIKRRCFCKSDEHFKYYGNRGVKICEEWLKDFMNFYEWSVNNGYREDLTIDRVDVNGNYCPENCRWITMLEQQSNKRNTRRITYNNQTKTLMEWSSILGMSYSILNHRLYEYHWSIEKAFETLVRSI